MGQVDSWILTVVKFYLFTTQKNSFKNPCNPLNIYPTYLNFARADGNLFKIISLNCLHVLVTHVNIFHFLVAHVNSFQY